MKDSGSRLSGTQGFHCIANGRSFDDNTGSTISPLPRPLGIRGFFKNLLYWLLDLDDEITLAEGRRRMRNSPGLLASLSPEALEYIDHYDGPEDHGPPLTKRERRDLERRLSSRGP
jgi:hypothetical protein